MPRFIKTAEVDVDAQRVVLGIKRDDHGMVVGRIVAMTVTHAGLTPTTIAPDDLPVEEAVREAVDLATSVESDMLWGRSKPRDRPSARRCVSPSSMW